MGSYQTTFELPDEWRGRRVLLEFDGIGPAATVWLNTWLGVGVGVGVGVGLGLGLANPNPNPNPNQDQTCPSMVIVHRLGQRRKANQHVSRVISPLSSITRCSCMPG